MMQMIKGRGKISKMLTDKTQARQNDGWQGKEEKLHQTKFARELGLKLCQMLPTKTTTATWAQSLVVRMLLETSSGQKTGRTCKLVGANHDSILEQNSGVSFLVKTNIKCFPSC